MFGLWNATAFDEGQKKKKMKLIQEITREIVS